MKTSFSDTNKPVWDYSTIIKMTIDRPVKDVWPYFFGDKEKIWTKVDYKRIAGEPGKVGDVYMQAYPSDEVYFAGQLIYEAIKVEPEKQLVLKITYRENEKSESRLVGYDFHTFSEVAGRTTVVLQQAFALPVMPNKDLDLESRKQNKMLADIFQNLKRVVESSR